MEQDKQLKAILLNSAEGVSAGFTDAVMKKVAGLSAKPAYYQPLVSPKLKKKFVFAFGAIVAAIAVLCLVIALADLNIVGWMQSIPVPDLNYNQFFLFIFIFWMLFILNRQLEKNVPLHRNSIVLKNQE